MGRKKKKSVNQEIPQATAVDLEELRCSFLEFCGVKDSYFEDTRVELIASLQAWRSSQPDDHASLELVAERLYSACDGFSEYLQLEVEEVSDIHRQIEQNTQQSIQDVLVYRSIWAAYLVEIEREEQLIGDIRMALERLYSPDPESLSLSKRIDYWIRQLKKRIAIKAEPWIQHLGGSESIDAAVCKNTESITEGLYAVGPSGDQLAGDLAQMVFDERQEKYSHFKTIEDEVDYFLDNPNSCTRIVLLLGSAGSGKSHICSEIEETCKEKSKGKDICSNSQNLLLEYRTIHWLLPYSRSSIVSDRSRRGAYW